MQPENRNALSSRVHPNIKPGTRREAIDKLISPLLAKTLVDVCIASAVLVIVKDVRVHHRIVRWHFVIDNYLNSCSCPCG